MFLLIDKPKGLTSHDVVDEIRKITGERRVGHAGTLDPNATGLLIVGIKRQSTKKLGEIAKDTVKEYVAEIELGKERDTGDVEGKVLRPPSAAQDDKSGLKSLPNLSKVKDILTEFVGKQEQVPPVYSAIKIKGKPAYKRARKGEDFKMEPRKVTIYSIEVLDYYYPMLKIKTTVSSGTYIRALARDIGRKLSTGAYLKNLKRTKIGKYSLEKASKLNGLSKVNWEDFAFDIK